MTPTDNAKIASAYMVAAADLMCSAQELLATVDAAAEDAALRVAVAINTAMIAIGRAGRKTGKKKRIITKKAGKAKWLREKSRRTTSH